MAVVVETGAIVPNANAFCDRTYVEGYAAARGFVFAGTNDEKDQAIVKGGDWLRNVSRLNWRGALKQYDQPMPFPRTGLTIKYGPAVPDNVVPQALKDANAELAIRARTVDLQPDLARGGAIQSERVDVISTTYFEGASPETLITAVMGYLKPFLRCEDVPEFTPFLAQAEDTNQNFTTGVFDPITQPGES